MNLKKIFLTAGLLLASAAIIMAKTSAINKDVASNTLTNSKVVCNGECPESATDKNTESNKKPKVSIIIPVYNGENYLDECLESAENQTLEDIEIICVNDGSKDNSLEILKKHQEKDNRIKIIDQENEGVSSARNHGIDASTGEFLAFLDCDDYVNKETYETSYNFIKQNNCDILCFGLSNFNDDGNKPFRIDFCPKKTTIFEDWKKAKRKRESIYACNKLYRRSLIKDNNITFNPNVKIAEDECFNLCIYPYAKKIIHIPYTFYNYRVNINSAMCTSTVKKIVSNYKKMWSYVNQFYKDRQINFSILSRMSYFVIYKEEFIPIVKMLLGFNN